MLTIAEHIADRSYPFNVRIILFGAEEIGLFGSRHYVENMSQEEIDNTIAMLNFDAFGSGRTLQVAGDIQLTSEATMIGKGLGVNLGHVLGGPVEGTRRSQRSRAVPTGRYPGAVPDLGRSIPHQLARR